MEMEFLSALNYNIYVHHDRFLSWATQCQRWMPTAQQNAAGQRPVKMPTRLSIKQSNSTPLSQSASLSSIMPSLSSSAPAVKRSAHDAQIIESANSTPSPYQPPAQKQRRCCQQMPYTPPDDTMSHVPFTNISSSSYPQTPLYTPPSQQYATPSWKSFTPVTTNASLNRPILSWSSSSTALASSRHSSSNSNTATPSSNQAYSVASAAAVAAVNSSYSTSLLASRVRCLEID